MLFRSLLTRAGRNGAKVLGLEPDAILARMRAADAKAVEGLDVPESFRVGLDLTTSGVGYLNQGYDTEAIAAYLADQPYRRLCVEYPAAEAARFPLAVLAPDTVVSLGVVDVATTEPEDVDELVDRIDQAAGIIDIDDIAISTNGGFAASPATFTEPEQRAKLQLVEMTARYFWGNELYPASRGGPGRAGPCPPRLLSRADCVVAGLVSPNGDMVRSALVEL